MFTVYLNLLESAGEKVFLRANHNFVSGKAITSEKTHFARECHCILAFVS